MALWLMLSSLVPSSDALSSNGDAVLMYTPSSVVPFAALIIQKTDKRSHPFRRRWVWRQWICDYHFSGIFFGKGILELLFKAALALQRAAVHDCGCGQSAFLENMFEAIHRDD